MSKFILTHTNGMVTIKIDADNVGVNSKNQRVIEAFCKNACDKIADYLDTLQEHHFVKEDNKK